MERGVCLVHAENARWIRLDGFAPLSMRDSIKLLNSLSRLWVSGVPMLSRMLIVLVP